MRDTALVIQCFVKPDTLDGLCQSLLGCAGTEDVDLIFWSDSPVGSQSENRFERLNEEVRAVVAAFTAAHADRFASVSFHCNDTNLGTCKTCQSALDHAFSDHAFAIFAEDDAIFAKDALCWFQGVRGLGLLDEPENWAIAGEAIFFNAREQSLPAGHADAMLAMAHELRLQDFYIPHQFIPSTCFATTRQRWAEFGATRGQPLGDEDVCARCQAEGRYGLFPMVPRVKDVGMLHDNGYSVMIHTKEGVREIKNTYVMSGDLAGSGQVKPRGFSQFTGDAGRIFAETTLLVRQADL